jgi:hypothetical protein
LVVLKPITLFETFIALLFNSFFLLNFGINLFEKQPKVAQVLCNILGLSQVVINFITVPCTFENIVSEVGFSYFHSVAKFIDHIVWVFLPLVRFFF